MLTSVDETLKGINASTSGMKKSEKAHAHSGLLSKTFPHVFSKFQIVYQKVKTTQELEEKVWLLVGSFFGT